METEHFKNQIIQYTKGANRDIDAELTFAQSNGEYLDSRNARSTSTDGNTGSIEKIKGEVILYTNSTALIGYECIGKASCNDSIIEVYANTNPLLGGIIKINGVIVLNSSKFDMRTDYPLQMDVNESSISGEFFTTDNRTAPYIFNVKDMVTSLTLNPNKYFSAFNPLLYQINLQSPLDMMAFIELINVGGGGGLPVGHYQYQIRYTSELGDRTNWSHPTPMIPIVQSLSSSSREYPWIKTYGGPPSPQSLTAFAPKLRFRVTNIFNYDYIEVKRISYNNGAGIEFSPNGVVVAKIDISPGEISVREYIDPQESNVTIALSSTDETQELAEIERAKSIRYFDRRLVLMNVKIASKQSNLTFKRTNDKVGWPVIDKLYKAGHKDPYNHVYRKSHMHGERYGYGIGLYDGVGTKAFATEVETLTNFEFPNRRDEISSETSNYSFYGTVRCADSTASNNVTQTHEVFDHYTAERKHDKCSFKNIHRPGSTIGATGTRLLEKVTRDCDEDEYEVENHGAKVSGAGAAAAVSTSYHPFTPVRQNDSDVEGHNYRVNTIVHNNTGDVEGSGVDYHPDGFGPDYYAQGIMISGVDNFPKWAKSFSVVRTKPAKKVVCQGVGFYALQPAVFSLLGAKTLGSKETNKVWFHSPDIDNGIVSSDVLNDIIDNPQNYKVQFVSPLGFFSELYHFEDGLLDIGGSRDRLADIICYVRLMRDALPDNEGLQINPTESANMGVPGGDSYNYVAYEKFRNQVMPNAFSGHADKGNRVFDISIVRRKTSGRGNYIEIETAQDFYNSSTVGGQSERNFEDEGMKNWTEPIYIVNIIRVGAEIKDQNIQKYLQTDHYQKIESIIGRGNGLPNQKYILVDERWEDSIPAPNSSIFGANIDRYCYIKKDDGTEEKWINVTYKTPLQIATIKADIASLGAFNADVKGIYTHNNIDNQNRFYELVFSDPLFIPSQGDFIVVRYDNTAPIRVYGGDTYVGETIFSPIDRQTGADDDTADTNFAFGLGLPYFKWRVNPRYYIIRKAGAAVNAIQDELEGKLKYIRQLCVMATVETRCATHLAHCLDSPKQFFPAVNYVIRANRWDVEQRYRDNGIFQDYEDDYGQEIDSWKWGGFRFLPQINPDYSTTPRIAFFSKPKYGFVEKTEFPTRITWSLSRPINSQDTPGLKTFPANNSYDIDDDQGEIKYAYECTSSRGENLYAITNKGICFLVTRKSVLSDLGGGDIGYMAADSFVKQQMWLSKDIGMRDEWWRSAAEGFAPVGDDTSRAEALFFSNNESVFMMIDNDVKDIGRLNYYSKIFKTGISKVGVGFTTKLTGFYNKKHQEYWLHIKGDVNDTFVFNKSNMAWSGTFDYSFEQFVWNKDKSYGIRNFETFELNNGYIINGSPVIFEVTSGASQDQFFDKEFTRIRINSVGGIKPTLVEFYKQPDGLSQCELDPAGNTLYLKDYRGFEQYVPRIKSSIDAKRLRFQGRLILFKIIHNLATEFKVIDSSIFYKLLK